jgi:CHAD domain-containing protein
MHIRPEQEVERVCVQLARGHLAAATRAARRLKDPRDSEALHDFRVALRRLRSLLRAYRRVFRPIPKSLRRRLKRLARATNRARDAEVGMAWMQRPTGLPATARPALGLWRARLEAERDAAYGEARVEAGAGFADLRPRLAAAFTRIKPGRNSRRYDEVLARRIAAHAEALRSALASIESIDQAGAIHAARIEGKRLRYLIEPLVAALPAADTAVRAMKTFQDRLGELCDLFVLVRTIERLAAAEAAERSRSAIRHAWGGIPETGGAGPERGRAELVRLVRRQAEVRYASIERRYLGTRAAHLTATVERLARRLRSSRRPARRAVRPVTSKGVR